jgi:hypothetical protein
MNNRIACFLAANLGTAAMKTASPGKRPAPESGAKRGRVVRLNRAKNRQNCPLFQHRIGVIDRLSSVPSRRFGPP